MGSESDRLFISRYVWLVQTKAQLLPQRALCLQTSIMFMSRSFSLSFIFTIALIFLILDVSNASEHAFNHKPARLLKKRLAAASSSSTSSSSGSTQSSSDSASHTLQNTNSDSSIPSTTSAADPTSSSSATSSLVSTSLAVKFSTQ